MKKYTKLDLFAILTRFNECLEISVNLVRDNKEEFESKSSSSPIYIGVTNIAMRANSMALILKDNIEMVKELDNDPELFKTIDCLIKRFPKMKEQHDAKNI